MSKRRSDSPAVPVSGQLHADPVFWAAWLYHEQGLKQDQIAGYLGCSRASVFNLLQRARDDGIVSITINPSRLQQAELTFELVEALGLSECHLLPTAGSELPLSERLGQFGARVLANRVGAGDVIGVSWGRTVLALSQSLSPRSVPGATVAQINGSAMATYDFSPEFCTSNIARKLDARCVNLLAPGVVSSSRMKTMLMREPLMCQHFELIRQCAWTLFGVTHLGSDTLLDGSGFMSKAELAVYHGQQAVGFASGYFFDIDGQVVVNEFDERYIVMPLQDFRNVPQRVCVGGGLDKVDAILGMTRAGLANVLITDEDTARALCERLQ